MVIKTLNENFIVINQLEKSYQKCVYLCINDIDNNKYLIICVKDSTIAKNIFPFFANKEKHKDFTDYVECFIEEGFLYIVFLYNEHDLLVHKLQREVCTLEERLEVGKSLLEKIILLNIPFYLLVEALKEENLSVSSSLDIFLNYDLDIYNFKKFTILDVNKKLAKVFYMLYKREINMESVDLLNDFINGLNSGDYLDYMSIYKDYMVLYEYIRHLSSTGELKYNSIMFRAWEKIKVIFISFKNVFVYLALFVVFLYMIITVTDKKISYEESNIFQNIGTIDINE